MNTTKIFKTNDGLARSGDFSDSDSYRPCPKCSSPAKINKDIHSASCSFCREEFCVDCFKKWNEHKSELCSNKIEEHSIFTEGKTEEIFKWNKTE